MRTNLFLLLVIVFATTSCKKHLSRKDAEMQIINAKHLPIIVDYEFTKSFTKDENTDGRGVTVIIGEDEFKEKQKMIEAFGRNKLVKFEETPHREETTQWLLGTTIRTWTTVSISLTEEGRKYLLQENDKSYKVKLWETGFDAISGILEKDKTAKVDYTISNKKITPFGENFSEKNMTTQKIAYFSMYDDGWKISNEN